MTFLAPGFFLASLGAAAVVVALHFIVTRQPRAGVLPTARFVPDLPATAIARATRPSDLLLMVLRVLLLLAVGAGLARPVLKPSRSAAARVVLADVSRSTGDIAAVRDSLRALLGDGDALVVFDSASRTIHNGARDSISSLTRGHGLGNLSSGLVAAVRAGSVMRERADSLELVVVSSFARGEIDAATPEIRSLWPGRARVVRIASPAADMSSAERNPVTRAPAGDPLAVTAALATTRADALIVRDGSLPPGVGEQVVVAWPSAARPRGAIARASRDTIGGVLGGDALVVAAFERRWSYPADSLRGASVIARWIDGEPAALEWNAAGSCARSVSVPVTAAGDLVIRRDFVAFVAAMSAPCIDDVPVVPADPRTVTTLQGSGGLASRDAFKPPGDAHSWMAPWLLALAIACAIAELFIRRRRVQVGAVSHTERARMASAA